MKRETGYYWVKRIPDQDGNTEWEIALYEVLGNRNVWTLGYFDDLEFQDNAFCEINETRILNPDEKSKPGQYRLQKAVSPHDELVSVIEQWNDLEFCKEDHCQKMAPILKKQVAEMLYIRPTLSKPTAKIYERFGDIYNP